MSRITFFLALALCTGSLQAQTLKLSHLFGDHAVMQQETQAPVWGWGKPGATVEVQFDGQSYKTRVAADGAWRVAVNTPKADGLVRTLVVKSGKESLTAGDIALGEVWLCSGQSNMEMPIRGFGFQEVEGATEAILSAPETASDVRVFNILTPKKYEPIDDVDVSWAYTDGATTAQTSAVAYFFARRLTKTLGVPVGIIVNAWGGSRIEPWMTKEVINSAGLTRQELDDLYAVEDIPDRWPETPETIWNGRVHPIVGYAARGILWYQGCSNMGQPHCYDKLQKAMVEMWRKEWGRDLPFIFTLLAPFDHSAICTETLGNKVTVHPAKKREVADMMLLRALQSVYGINPGTSVDLPRLGSVEYLEDGRVKVRLTQVWSDLGSISARDVVGFELAGEDREFHLAKAEIDWDGQTIVVQCPEVPKPIAVRYGFRNWMGANLQKSNGLPVPPFRSDDWEY